MLFATVERSPTVAGKVKSFDPAPALAVRGVKKVLELAPIPAQLKTFGGVAVVADNTWSALEGREALAIEWDRGTASENSVQFRQQLETLVNGDGKVFRNEGDYAAAKAGAAKTITATYHGPHLAHAPMEPLAAVALVKDGKCEVWAPIQDPQGARGRVAAVVGLPEEAVTIHVTLLGGGFGRKSKPDFILEAVQVAKAMEGTPIKLTWKREDEIRHGYYRGQNAQRVEATLDGKGAVTGWRHHTAFPTIASTFAPAAKDPQGFELGMGLHNLPWRIPNIQLEASGIASDLRIGWLRSVCNTFHAHAIQCFTDELAEAVGKDPVQFQLELLGEPRKLDFSGHDKPYGFETGRLSKVIEAAAEMANWGSALPQGMGHGFAAHFSFLTYVAMAMKASVEEGQIRVHEVHCAVDCGAYVNPDTVKAQMEGAVVFGLSYALYGEITAENGAVKQGNFNDYPLLRIDEMPVVHVKLFPANGNPPAGVGEPGVPPVSAALANALYKATGKRYRDLPLQKQLSA
jgi:isoquinoline 1-oxidoreductase beta subunit